MHSSRHVFGAEAYARRGDLKGRIGNPELATQDAIHPVVIRHPETGRKALYVNPGLHPAVSTAGPRRKSRPLLDYLYRHAVRPEFTCRFQWRPGSLAFWDNRSTWHFAVNDYHGERRLLAPHHDRGRAAELKGIYVSNSAVSPHADRCHERCRAARHRHNC